ncbi:MAG TPA: ATP-binding cassette domain-containing protein [Pedobacter sp.]|uniref:ATP-binding cassette domain-containing protein n=1 Tax=Pedobacter sp. TaxID=1411316 RepID=UPI002BA1621A|nr:ATP-binding cassette domain-containing protein [Pedobacter sp.]HMI03853.1 ATP-binding cassette domain-containing protein [Pedobacter sp.]
MNGLHVDSVTKNFGLRQVLTDVFISCKKGEVIGLLGRNGSGKSTLLKIIFGSLNADNKFIRVNGRHLKSLYDNIDTIQYLPQDSFLPKHIRIADIIKIFCIKHQVRNLLELSLIKPHLRKKSGELSGGEQRIIEVLIMIYSEAEYLLFDEPFNGLGPLHVEIIKDLIKAHSDRKGFIITDHDYRNVLDISTGIILMHDGGTKIIKDKNDLVRWGYLPSSSLSNA